MWCAFFIHFPYDVNVIQKQICTAEQDKLYLNYEGYRHFQKRNCVDDIKGTSSEHGLTVGIGKEREERGSEKSRVCNMGKTGGKIWGKY